MASYDATPRVLLLATSGVEGDTAAPARLGAVVGVTARVRDAMEKPCKYLGDRGRHRAGQKACCALQE